MICCMPFTYLDDRYIRKLTGALGTVSIYGTAPGIMPDHMLARAQEGLVDLRYPQGVDADDLPRAFQEFKAWAELHRGDIADMAAYIKPRKGQPPLVDETNPTAIGDQIRNFTRKDTPEREDSAFRAALFLAMAQEYDQKLEAIAQDLGTVSAMEEDMLARLAGDARDRQEGLSAALTADKAVVSADPGAFMTDRRVQAWAELACKDDPAQAFTLFVTPSPSVLERLLDRSPQARGPWRVGLAAGGAGAGEPNAQILNALKSLAGAQDEASWPDDPALGGAAGEHAVGLEVYVLAGTPPDRFARQLMGADSGAARTEPCGRESVNTLIGLLER